MSRPTVLVTDGGSGQGRSAVAAVRALASGGYRPVVTTSGPNSLAAASRWCAESIAVPPVGTAGYAEAVHEAVARTGALTVLPASDAALLALDAPVADLVDKVALAARAATVGLETPRSFECDGLEGLRTALADGGISLPVVVKPAISTRPARLVASVEDASTAVGELGPFLVQPFVHDGMWAIAGVVAEGRTLAAVQQRYLRIWPVPCGTSCAAVSVPVDEERLGALERLLDGYEGVFQAQFAGDHLLDVNPRVYGSLSLAVAAGVNLPAIWCAWLQRRAVPTSARGSSGVHYRWLEGDIRNLASGVRCGRLGMRTAAAALLPHLGTAHSVEALSDPGPLVARLRYALSARQ